MEILGLADGLAAEGRSVFLGWDPLDSTGRPTFAHAEDQVTVLGPPRSGKSSAIFAPSVACHPGPVVVTSTRAAGLHPDLRDVTLSARTRIAYERHGYVAELAIDEAVLPVAQAVYWDIIDGCGSWNVALERARSLAGAAIPLSQENAISWRNSVTSFLAPLLHVAAYKPLTVDGMLEFARFAHSERSDRNGADDPPSFESARAFLASHYGYSHPSIRECDTVLSATAEVQSNVLYVVRTDVFGILSYESHTECQPFDIGRFLDGWGTLYITVRPQRSEQCRSMIAGLIDALVSTWQTKTMHHGTLLLALDEVANVAPIATLPEIVASGGGSGIQAMLGFQSPAQASRCWGLEGIDTVVRAPTHMVVFPGLADRSFLDDAAGLFGQEVRYENEVRVASAAPVAARSVDAMDLVRERRRLDEYLGAFPSGRARDRAERQIARTLANERRRGRFHGLGSGDVLSPEEVVAEIRRWTDVDPKADRRPRLEGSDIYRGLPGSAFVKSNDKVTRTPRYSFNSVPGWYDDPLWTGLLGP